MANEKEVIESIREALEDSQLTPGPWVFHQGDDWVLVAPNSTPIKDDVLMCNTHYYPWCPSSEAHWKFIAACNPSAIRSLLARLEEVERKNAALIEAGRPLATIAFNLSQNEGVPLKRHMCESMRLGVQQWDAALSSKEQA